MFTAARKAYADGERRRVPVKFYAKVRAGEPVMAAVADEDGHRAVLTGPVPEPAQRAPLTEQSLADQFAKTGGTPYYSTGTESRIDPGLYLPAAAVNDLRRRLITGLKDERAGAARAAQPAAAAAAGGQALLCRPRAHRAGASGRAAHAGACRAVPGVCVCAGRNS